MYIQRYKRTIKGKVFQSTFLVESYRENGKVKHRHLANFSALPEHVLMAIGKELRGEQVKDGKRFTLEQLRPDQGKNCGGIIAINQLAKQIGITQALGKSKEAKLALVQIMGRILSQGSRLYIAGEWAAKQALQETLNIGAFNEDSLYVNLDWLSENQERIENELFKIRLNRKKVQSIYLYDVTSSYFEGTQNELAAFGYNRDGKKGKMQIVIGLLCDNEGYPISIEVFEGNTQDPSSVGSQLLKLKNRFGIENVIMVGDRGMIKSQAIETINELNWHYITAITKPQIDTLIKSELIQLEMFTDELMEVEQDGIRYILRRNPYRAKEIETNRTEKLSKLKAFVKQKNIYLSEHPKAKHSVALAAIVAKASKLKMKKWISIESKETARSISVKLNKSQLDIESKLDGCYVIKSDVSKTIATADTLHSRYKDLAKVELAFRTMKQSFEELRPIFVRKEKRTRGHVFVCMLSYIIIKNVWNQCKNLELTEQHIFELLDDIQYVVYNHKNIQVKVLPKTLLPQTQQIINKLNIKLPAYL